MKEENKIATSLVISLINAGLTSIFFMLSGVSSSSDIQTNSYIFLPIAKVLGFIAIMAFLYFTLYGYLFYKQEREYEIEGNILLWFGILVLYATPSGFIKAWYDNEIGWFSLILILLGTLFAVIATIIIILDYIDGVETSIILIISLFTLVLWLLPLGFVIYHRDVYFQNMFVGWFETLSKKNISSDSLISSWWLWGLNTLLVLYFLYRIWLRKRFFKPFKYDKNGDSRMMVEIDDNIPPLVFNRNFNQINIGIGICLISFSVFGIHYLMSQKEIYPEKDFNSLLITEAVWIVLCIGMPIYHLYVSKISQLYAKNIENYLAETEIRDFERKLRHLEFDEKLELEQKNK